MELINKVSNLIKIWAYLGGLIKYDDISDHDKKILTAFREQIHEIWYSELEDYLNALEDLGLSDFFEDDS